MTTAPTTTGNSVSGDLRSAAVRCGAPEERYGLLPSHPFRHCAPENHAECPGSRAEIAEKAEPITLWHSASSNVSAGTFEDGRRTSYATTSGVPRNREGFSLVAMRGDLPIYRFPTRLIVATAGPRAEL